MCSPGRNQLIDHHNIVDGNEVKIRQAVDSSVGLRVILLKNSKVMSKAFMLYLNGKVMEKSCACVRPVHHAPLLYW